MTDDYNIVGKLSENYSDRPILKSLLSLVPYWGVADTLLQHRASEIKADRIKIFFDALANGSIELTDTLIETEDFIHCYMATISAVTNTRRREKIKLFAKLFSSALTFSDFGDTDEYEFLLSILDELTIKELAVLKAIERYEENYYVNGQFDNEHRPHEGLLKKEVCLELGISEDNLGDDELKGIVIRLNRTGCYTLMGWRQGPAVDCSLTGIYFKLKALIQPEVAVYN